MTAAETSPRANRSTTWFNTALALGLAAAGVLVFVVARSLFGGSPFPNGSDGEWRTTNVVIDEHIVELEIGLTIDDGDGSYRGACNSSSVSASETISTAKGCEGELDGYGLMEIDARLLDAIDDGGELSGMGDELVFDGEKLSVTFGRVEP